MFDFLHGFFSAGLKTNVDNSKFSILTGRLHIPLQSGLNNLDVDDITTTCRYADIFGFTQGEVDRILCEMGFSEKREAVREWYGGYRFGNKTELYSPCSLFQEELRGQGGHCQKVVVSLCGLSKKRQPMPSSGTEDAGPLAGTSAFRAFHPGLLRAISLPA